MLSTRVYTATIHDYTAAARASVISAGHQSHRRNPGLVRARSSRGREQRVEDFISRVRSERERGRVGMGENVFGEGIVRE